MVQRATHTAGMPVRLRHIVADAHDLPGLARFWTQALGWKVLSERENEVVIGTGENAPAGMCFMPVAEPKTVKNRVHLDLISSAADRDQEIDRLGRAGDGLQADRVRAAPLAHGQLTFGDRLGQAACRSLPHVPSSVLRTA